MESPLKQSRWRLYLTIATFIILAVLIYSLRRDIGGVIQNLGKVNAFALLLMAPIEFFNYDAYARLNRALFAILGKTVEYRDMLKFTVELNFVNHILPSGGVSGISYFNVRTRSLGINVATSTSNQLTVRLLLFASYLPLLVLGVFFLALRGRTNNLILVVASSLITLVIVGFFVAFYIAEDRNRVQNTLTFITKLLNKLIQLIRPRHPETINISRAQEGFDEIHDNYKRFKNSLSEFKLPFLYATVVNVTEVAAVYVVYIAFGRLVNVGAVILAYAVANFAGLISVLPAGIGVYEGLMTAVLAATGIPAELSIPVTIMYRVLNMFIQLTPGYFFYQKAVQTGLGRKA